MFHFRHRQQAPTSLKTKIQTQILLKIQQQMQSHEGLNVPFPPPLTQTTLYLEVHTKRLIHNNKWSATKWPRATDYVFIFATIAKKWLSYFSPFNPPLSYFLILMTQANLSTWPVFLSQPKQRWGYMFFSLSTQGSLIISLSNTSDLQFPQSAMNTRRGRGWRCSISAATKLLRLVSLTRLHFPL